jgi:hypothetical protein
METLTETMYIETCCECGVTFAFTAGYYNDRREDGKSFCCPNGHKQYYTNSEAQKLKNALANAKRQEETANWWREQAEEKGRSLSATRGQITKIKNRIAKGICPCCNQSFDNLHDHMTTQHPEYLEK